MRFLYSLFLLMSIAFFAQAQKNDSTILANKKVVNAVYIERPPKIDGLLTDSVWQLASPAVDFTEYTPDPNTQASQRTEVRVLYTTQAIYIGAKMYDTAPDSILKQLCVRDDIWSANTDKFAVFIDGMFQQQNAFMFGVTAAGVQYDASDYDDVWDAVWKSKVKIGEEGWTAEMEIPYSQLRFPKGEVQTWGINFERGIRRVREGAYWSKIDPAIEGEVQQFGLLKGIERIKPPLRLSFTPYAAFYLRHFDDKDTTTKDWRPTGSAGADMKLGINESFTLDLSLVPDFGDVLTDDYQFNLSPFEIYYEERRPFFTEGTELFQRAGIFYSRRVGGLPTRYGDVYSAFNKNEEVVKNPDKPWLINALKLSGRNKKGLALGVFNAVTAPTWATLQDSTGNRFKWLTEPATNYNVLVVDQQFMRYSYISVIQTSVIRPGGFRNAFVTGTDFRIADKNNKYAVSGNAAFSQVLPDTMQSNDRYIPGYRYSWTVAKVSGNWRFSVNQSVANKTINLNDLGYFTQNNYFRHSATVNYYVFKPFSVYNNLYTSLTISYSNMYNPLAYSQLQLSGSASGTFKNFLSAGMDFAYQPLGYHDYFEPRVDGRYWDKPAWGRIGGWFSSDYRKRFALDGGFSYRRFAAPDTTWRNSQVMEGWLTPIIRISDRMNLSLNQWTTYRTNGLGFVTRSGSDIIFGSRRQWDMENTISVNYLFTDVMSLSLRVRHYWAAVHYEAFWVLTQDGKMGETTYTNDHDANFNTFNIDLIYRWRFAPGSELNVVWKNSVFSYTNAVQPNFFKNFAEMFDAGQGNQFSVKVLYFFDVNQFRKNVGKRL